MRLGYVFYGVNTIALCIASILEDLNWNRYFHATVAVVTGKRGKNQISSVNTFLETLPTDSINQHFIPTWIVKTMPYRLNSVAHDSEIQNVSFRYRSWKPEKVLNRGKNDDKRESVNFLAIDIMQLTDERNHMGYPDWRAYTNWGAFLFYVTSNRRISLSKQNFLILSFSEYGFKELLDKVRLFGLFRAPFSTLVVYTANPARDALINELLIVCVNCCYHASIHLTKMYFIGSFGSQVRSFINKEMRLCKIHVHKLKTVIDDVDNQLSMSGELECSHFPWKKIYHQPRNLQQCFEPRVLSFRILGDALNLTSSNGGFSLGVDDTVYLRNAVLRNWIITNIHLEAYSIFVWDWSQYVVRYCESTETFRVENMYNILFSPFDVPTWYLISVCISLIMVCNAVQKGSGFVSANVFTYNAVALEVITLLFQRSIGSYKDSRILLLIGFFFIEFVYLRILTESMISPLEIVQKDTLKELLDLEYWFTKDSYSQNMYEVFTREARQEGYFGNLVFKERNSPDRGMHIRSYYSYQTESALKFSYNYNGCSCRYVQKKVRE